MRLKTITWERGGIAIIDQTALPGALVYRRIRDVKTLWKAIRELKVRGAPALGAAAALGVYLGIKDSKAGSFAVFARELEACIQFLGSSRPTARNLFWGLERMAGAAKRNCHRPVQELKRILFAEAKDLIRTERATCRSIGEHGATLIKDKDRVLTICNAGILAAIDYGTALAVLYRARAQGKKIKVFACETRPLLQGARLTAWELAQKGIDVTLICDSMAATLMQRGKVDKVLTGADRIAANGDVANKIGTYNLAVLCRYHRIPLYVAAPLSTFDPGIRNGRQIPIEERPAYEVTELFFKKPIAAKNTKVFNPAFDVTPHGLITAIVTEQGIIRPPFALNIRRMFKSHHVT